MNELLHVGVLGMRWGHRRAKQNAFYEKHGMRKPKSNADKYKVIGEKLVSKAKSKEFHDKAANAAKDVTNFLMTPRASKIKWTDMSSQEKGKTLVESALLTAGAMGLVYLSTKF